MLSYIDLKLPYSESKPFYPSNDNSDIPNKQETESFLSMKKQPLRTVFSRSLVMKMLIYIKEIASKELSGCTAFILYNLV